MMHEAPSLAGRTIVVTGAAGGIGRAVMTSIEAAGGRTVGWDRQGDGGVKTVDITDRAAVLRALSALELKHGVHGLVTAAGVIGKPGGTFMDVEEDEWHRVLHVNVWGTFNVLQCWARLCVTAGRPGSAVTVASMAVRTATAHNPHYVASKGGVDALTRSAAAALAPHGIRVNAVAPGPVPTGLNPHRWQTEEGRAGLLKGIALGRLGTPEDVAHAVTFLLSDASSWTTGATLYVDGGLTAVRPT